MKIGDIVTIRGLEVTVKDIKKLPDEHDKRIYFEVEGRLWFEYQGLFEEQLNQRK